MSEILEYWADLGDNRIGPLLKELVAAIADTENPELLQRLSVRLKFMSGSVNSMARRQSACKPTAPSGGR